MSSEENKPNSANPVSAMDAVNNVLNGAGNDPLEMVRNSLQQINIVTPEQIVKEVEQKIVPVPEVTPELPKQEETIPTVPTETLLDAVEEERSPANSIRNLRRKTNELGKTLEEKESALQVMQSELEKYKAGEIPSEKQAKQEEEMKELRKYQKLHALKTTPEYKDQILNPINEARQSAIEYAKTYELPEEIVDQAKNLSGKELNYFLRDYFDEIGAMEFKQKLTAIKDREHAREVADAEPARILDEIMSSTESAREFERQESLDKLSKSSTSGWKTAIQEIQQEGIYPELMVTDDDSEHNKYSEPIIQRAASEYGKFINLLAQIGAKDLPPEAAKILAKRFQLSEAAALMSKSREAHYTTAEDLINTTRERAPYMRPNVGSGVNGGATPAPQKSWTPQDAADALVNKFFK